jgi:hypothetical protein
LVFSALSEPSLSEVPKGLLRRQLFAPPDQAGMAFDHETLDVYPLRGVPCRSLQQTVEITVRTKPESEWV